ncbi:MAG TPA: trehalose-6-phosphate synthase [Actinomycetota bacterium]|jgi:trehalose 6-phosphate synthase|nr:trehalose-6-phosphate synthase [Actinomycetota bacterium]
MKDRIVLVSNRGPVSFRATEEGFETKRGAGGLAGALDPVARRLGDNAIWIAAANSDDDRKALSEGAVAEVREELGYPLRLLDIDPDTYDRYYNTVSNRMLWFANHCLWDELGTTGFGEEELDAWSSAYEPVNRLFASAVAEVAVDDSLVLLQDYHLATAPGYLRDMEKRVAIGHFTHSSFCGPRGLEALPEPIPSRVIEGMLGADLLGFHIGAWVKGFLHSCDELGMDVDYKRGTVNHSGRTTWVRAYPIPIDAVELHERVATEEVQQWAERFSVYTDLPLIVRADRAEISKNVVRGFEAFGALLDRRADLRGEVRFVACLYPSRQSMPEYQGYIDQIQAVVEEVNERYPGSIELFFRDDYDRTLGALMNYDVLLVNSIMDGMNLVSKEGPTVNRRDGVLVLTSGAGSFEELGKYAVPIADAYDIEETAAALERALAMDMDDRKRRAEGLRSVVETSTPEDWIESQLNDLSEISEGRTPATPPSK